jgi:NhaP-type Na+/H+ or K+/H+ antiporter
MAITILVIGLLVFFGHVLTAVFQRTKVPDVLVLMIAGILLGPLFHVVEPEDFGKVGGVFTTVALVVILFEGGIHLNLRQLGTGAGDTLAITLATAAVTMLLLAHLADLLLPLDFPAALLVGVILSGTSSAVVVPMLHTLRLDTRRSGTVLFLESAFTDVLVIVLSLGLLQALVAFYLGNGVAVSAAGLAWRIVRSFLAAALVGAAGALFWSAVLERIRRFPNTVFTTLAYVFILFGLTELAGYSGAIAALAFGVSVANLPLLSRPLGRLFRFRLTPFAEHERAFFAEVVFLVKTFFFVYLGVSMTFTDLRAVAAGLALAAAAFAARAPVIRFLGSREVTRREAGLMWALVPKGLAPAVLASLPGQVGLPGSGPIQGTVYATILFSIVGCASLVFAVERGLLAPFLAAWFGKFPAEAPAAAVAPKPELPAVATLSSTDLLADLHEPNPLGDLDRPRSGTAPDDPEDREAL